MGSYQPTYMRPPCVIWNLEAGPHSLDRFRSDIVLVKNVIYYNSGKASNGWLGWRNDPFNPVQNGNISRNISKSILYLKPK